MSKRQSPYKTGTARITVNYGYDIHSIELSGRSLSLVLKGRGLTLRGQGFPWEGRPDPDNWEFNEAELGSLRVYTDGVGEIFNGNLANGEVWISLDGKDMVLNGQ
jgi:hypothetical protein